MSDRIEQIRARLEKATPGPWRQEYGTVYPELAQPGSEPLVDADGSTPVMPIWPILSGANAGADADFIAHSREDIEWLLADAKRLAEALLGVKEGIARSPRGADMKVGIARSPRGADMKVGIARSPRGADMKVGIVGSRTFTDAKLMRDVLYEQVDLWDLVVVSGGAEGADALAALFARARGLPLIEHLPDRDRYGWPAAAFERNSLIVDDAEELFAFFGPGEPESVNKSGTMDTVRKAIAKRIPVHMYFQPHEERT